MGKLLLIIHDYSSMIDEYLEASNFGKTVPLRLLDQVKDELITRRPQAILDTESSDISPSFIMGGTIALPVIPESPEKKTFSMSVASSLLGNAAVSAIKYLVRNTVLMNIVMDAESCKKLVEPMDHYNNPLMIKAILNFCLVYNKYEEEDEDISKVIPMQIAQILQEKTLKGLFVAAIGHFRKWLFG